MKICCTTSDRYHHILPVFFFLFEKYWGGEVELVGYKEPKNLPSYCSFHSMGEQRGPQYFSDDLIKYFEKQEQEFCWMMEDSFLRAPVDRDRVRLLIELMRNDATIGRISLTSNSIHQYTETYSEINGVTIYQTPADSVYRLSTQPAIWNKNYLLKWLLPGLDPWKFEHNNGMIQEMPDHEFKNLALDKFNAPLIHNEGVRKRDIHAFDLNGIDENVSAEMKQLNIL